MSSGTNAHPARGGFNQSGGAYFICLADLDTNTGAAAGLAGSVGGASYVTALVNAGSNSGGAWVPPTLSTVTMVNVVNGGTGTAVGVTGAKGFVTQGKLLKDMGKTVVSAGRTFRKFAPVVAGLGVSSFGVAGGPAVGANAGYGSFYLEVGREGLGPTPVANTTLGPAPIARYF